MHTTLAAATTAENCSEPSGLRVKALYGLPCANCRCYYRSDLAICPICRCADRVSSKPALGHPIAAF